MLTTNLKLAEKYNYLDSKFKKAFEFLRTADLGRPAAGQHAHRRRQGLCQCAGVHDSARADAPFESTRNILTCSSSSPARNASALRAARYLCKPAMAYDADRDLVFYEEPAESGCIILKAGDFAIVPPEDAHAPRRQTAAGACTR